MFERALSLNSRTSIKQHKEYFISGEKSCWTIPQQEVRMRGACSRNFGLFAAHPRKNSDSEEEERTFEEGRRCLFMAPQLCLLNPSASSTPAILCCPNNRGQRLHDLKPRSPNLCPRFFGQQSTILRNSSLSFFRLHSG